MNRYLALLLVLLLLTPSIKLSTAKEVNIVIFKGRILPQERLILGTTQ